MKFSLCDLLLVTLIVALTIGWWLDRSRLARENRRLRNWRSLPYYTSGPAPDFLMEAERKGPVKSLGN